MDEEDQASFLTGCVPSLTNIVKIRPRALNDSAFSDERFKVFLRLKPYHGTTDAYVMESDTTLVTNTPKESVVFHLQKNPAVKRRFTFSHILPDTVTQADTFRVCVAPMLKSLFEGTDSVVMTHGTTSAGKTFTMHGTSGFPGVIPRFIFYLFRALDGLIEPSGRYIYGNSSVSFLDYDEYQKEETYKQLILGFDGNHHAERSKAFSIISTSSSIVGSNAFENMTFKEIEAYLNSEEENPFGWAPSNHYSVAISMVEIYNENVIDLLVLPKTSRQYLTLGEGSNGFYVKNAKYISVRNGYEAFQISQYGRNNLHRGSNNLNAKSSRSHCIFSMVLMRHTSKSQVQISRFSFVDLAGSERVKKTLNTGVRLEESKSINKSLTVLGKCIHVMKMNQIGRNPLIVPFRDSKLTSLFKNALTGQSKLTFIVNISKDPKLFDETLQVLNFSSIAQDIVVVPKPVRKVNNRFSRIMDSGIDFKLPGSWAGAIPEEPQKELRKELQEAKEEISALLLLNEEYERELQRKSEIERSDKEALLRLRKDCSRYKELYEKYSQMTSEFLEEQEKESSRENKLFEDLVIKETQFLTLQEKYGKLKYKMKKLEKTSDEVKRENDDLKRRNDELKRDLQEYCSILDDAQKAYRELEEENEELQRMKLDLAMRLEDEVRRKVLDQAKDEYELEINHSEGTIDNKENSHDAEVMKVQEDEPDEDFTGEVRNVNEARGVQPYTERLSIVREKNEVSDDEDLDCKLDEIVAIEKKTDIETGEKEKNLECNDVTGRVQLSDNYKAENGLNQETESDAKVSKSPRVVVVEKNAAIESGVRKKKNLEKEIAEAKVRLSKNGEENCKNQEVLSDESVSKFEQSFSQMNLLSNLQEDISGGDEKVQSVTLTESLLPARNSGHQREDYKCEVRCSSDTAELRLHDKETSPAKVEDEGKHEEFDFKSANNSRVIAEKSFDIEIEEREKNFDSVVVADKVLFSENDKNIAHEAVEIEENYTLSDQKIISTENVSTCEQRLSKINLFSDREEEASENDQKAKSITSQEQELPSIDVRLHGEELNCEMRNLNETECMKSNDERLGMIKLETEGNCEESDLISTRMGSEHLPLEEPTNVERGEKENNVEGDIVAYRVHTSENVEDITQGSDKIETNSDDLPQIHSDAVIGENDQYFDCESAIPEARLSVKDRDVTQGTKDNEGNCLSQEVVSNESMSKCEQLFSKENLYLTCQKTSGYDQLSQEEISEDDKKVTCVTFQEQVNIYQQDSDNNPHVSEGKKETVREECDKLLSTVTVTEKGFPISNSHSEENKENILEMERENRHTPKNDQLIPKRVFRRSRSHETIVKSCTPLSRVLRSVSNIANQYIDEKIKHSPSPTKPVPKSKRKVKTGRKVRDPTEHPALTRGRGKRVEDDVPPPPRSAKKQLFSAEDVVDLSDSDSPMPMRQRLRSRRDLNSSNALGSQRGRVYNNS